MYLNINAHTLIWLSTHTVRMCTLIIGAQVYVYELCVDLIVFGYKVYTVTPQCYKCVVS